MSSIIDTFEETLTLNRVDGASTQDTRGALVSPSRTNTSITASVQPITGQELLNFPENQRVRQPIRLFTEAELKTVSQENKTEADIVIRGGINYIISTVEDWTGGDVPADMKHYRVVALRKDGQ